MKQTKPRFEVQAETVTPAEETVTVAEETAEPEQAGPQKILVNAVDIAAVMEKLANLEAELTQVKKQAARHVTDDEDLHDSSLFLARPNGNQWQERVVIDGKTRQIDMVGTAFYGPFASLEDVNVYLDEKGRKRHDSAIDWSNVQVLEGREARKLLSKERQERLQKYGGLTAVNILDRRMRPVMDQITGSLDRTGGVGVALPVRE